MIRNACWGGSADGAANIACASRRAPREVRTCAGPMQRPTREQPFIRTERTMARRTIKIDKAIKTAAGGPLVAAAYYAAGFAVRYVSCLPTYADAEFAGVPAAQFLLLALTGAALILTVFAALAGFKLYRQGRRARAQAGHKARLWGLVGVSLGVLALGAVAAVAGTILNVTCR